MPANLENSVVATELENVNFHYNPKERQCQRMFKLLYNCTHLTRYQSDAQNSPSQASVVCEPYFQMFKLNLEKAEEQEIKLTTSIRSLKKPRGFQKNIHFCFIDYAKAFDCVDHNKLWKILQKMGIPDHLTCLLRNLYTGQEATAETGHGTIDWFQIRKGVHKGCILSPYLFNLYAEYIMLDWMKHKLESRLPGEISITSEMQMTPTLW